MLILDDDAMSRELLTVMLQGHGFDVETAESGDAGLRRLEGRTGRLPQAVLADLQMPGTAGDFLAQRLRTACGSETLLLAMSGSAPREGTLKEFDGFLFKPFSVDQLLLTLTEGGAALSERRQPGPRNSNGDERVRVEERAALNEDIYRKLVDVMPPSQLHAMYMLCLDDGRKRLVKMRTFVSTRDEPAYLREAHALKGGCGMLGATELYELAKEMERTGLRSDEGELLITQIGVAFDRLQRMLDARA